MGEESRALLEEYEKSGDPDIAEHLIESLDVARKVRWEESTAQLNFAHSSRKSWSLLQRLGASQRPPRFSRPPVSPNAVAAHLIQVTKAPAEKTFEKQTCDGWRQQCRNRMSDAEPDPISEADVEAALNRVKLGTAPDYDNVHPEFSKHLGSTALTWLAALFTRTLLEHQIPKIWRQAKGIALEKPGKDPYLACSYRPISLLSVCYKLLECIILHRITPKVEELLSEDQAGFRRVGACVSK